ncbi:MAG: M16 family metallopeptidase [Reyranellales bacterium]
MNVQRALLAAVLGLMAWLPASRAGAVEIKEITTPLGIKAWLVEDKSAPVVALSFSFAGGAASEPEAQKGITSLAAALLTDGAGPLPSQAFRRRLEDAAVSLGFGASLDRLSGSLRVLSANRQEGFDLLRLAVTEPRFDPEMVEERRAQFIASLNKASQRPSTVAARTMMATVFLGHPYAADTEGVRESLKALTPDELKRRASSLLTRRDLIVAAVGDIDPAELARQLDFAFGSLPLGEPRTLPPEWTPTATPRTIVVERGAPQSSVQMTLPGIARDDPDWYAALVMTHILGGGQQSRLFNEVREKRGLAYTISSGLRTFRKASLLVISTGSANETVAEAVRLIRRELVRLRTEGAGEHELADAKTYLSGALALSLDSSGSIANLLQSLQVDRLPRDYLDRRASLIGAVTRDDVTRVARRLLRDEALTTIVVGKPVGLTSEP